jgi:hypothetical protein
MCAAELPEHPTAKNGWLSPLPLVRVTLSLVIATSPAGAAEMYASAADLVVNQTDPSGIGDGLAWAGDVDGDGVQELLIGSRAANGFFGRGQAYLLRGTSTGRVEVPGLDLLALYRRPWAEGMLAFGRTVAAAGDVDGDGLADIWVGDGHRAYLIPGAETGRVHMPRAIAVVELSLGDHNNARLLGGVDLSGDGIPDLVVGAGTSVLVIDGPFAGRIEANAEARLQVWHSWDDCYEFGTIIGVGNDLDGDGHQDLLVGSQGGFGCDYRRHLGFVRADLAGIVDMSDKLDPRSIVIRDSEVYDAAPVGDVNGDGFDDLAVNYNIPHLYVRVLWGPITSDVEDLAAAPGWTLDDPSGFVAGSPIRAAGDVDGDGLADLAVRGRHDDLYVVPGSAAGKADWADRSLRVILPPDAVKLGHQGLVGGHDADGDGIPELVIGVGIAYGRVYVLNGTTMAAHF